MTVLSLKYWPAKAPQDNAPYARDFTNWLLPASGDTPADEITGVPTVTFTGADNALVVGSISHSNGVVTAWLSGGTDGVVYTVTFTIQTTQGITIARSALLQVQVRS